MPVLPWGGRAVLSRRRALLAGVGGAAAGLVGARRTRAGWGTWPEGQVGPRPARRVLEMYAYGGMSAWDTFYCVPTRGREDRRFVYAFGEEALTERLGACGVAGLSLPFAVDANGATVCLGPWASPLWSRPDVLARMRVVVVRHDQFPHATAVPLALTGARLGQPGLAGTGAAVSRYVRELEGGTRPAACVVHPGDLSRLDNVQAALAVGEHPGAARPLELPLDRLGEFFGELVARPAVQGRAEAFDAVVGSFAEQYAERLRWPHGEPLRARELATWRAVDAARRAAPALADMVPPEVLGVATAEVCGAGGLSIPGLGLRLATHLLTRSDPLRYALWVDAGLVPTLDGGHDTHRDHMLAAPTNYLHSLQLLVDAIRAPGEAAPDKLDLDDTVVAITTEFGRTPQREDARAGLGHWPSGYVAVLIGGPVRAGVAGAIDERGVATRWATPTELRIALLMALGIYPFDAGAFGAGEVQGAADARAALRRIEAFVLGAST